MTDFVIDSSVLVASLIPSDRFFERSMSVIEKILTHKRITCTSVIVPTEVCGAIMRRTNDAQSARATRIQMQKWVQLGLLELVELNRKRMQEAQELAIKHSIKGMDAIITQVANERSLPLLTFDKELSAKISGSVETITEGEL